MIKIFLKVILSILFFICLLDMPYSFYQGVRFFALFVFVILAFQSMQDGLQTEVIIYIMLAILFQPIFKIALGRELWNIIDLCVGIGLIGSIFIKSNRK